MCHGCWEMVILAVRTSVVCLPRSCPLAPTSDTRDMCTSNGKYITPSGPGQLAGTRLPADNLYLTTKAGVSPAQQNIELTVSQTPPDLSLGFTLSASVVRVTDTTAVSSLTVETW